MANVTVLHSSAPPDGTTKFIVQLVEGAPPQLTLKFFSWRTALFGSYDVFHVHWPEFLIRSRNPLRRVQRRLLFQALLLRLRYRRIPLVRTLHNVQPHESGGRWESWLLAWAERSTTLFVRLNPTTDSPGPAVTILHGHYVDRFGSMELPAAVPGRILYFGLIRPYKGVERLLSVFSSVESADVSLRVVGKPSHGLGALVTAAADADPRVTCRLEFVPDAVLVREIGQSSLVVLPYLEMHNSGALLVALSLGRPVLAPNTPANAAMVEEVGAAWLLLFDGELTADVLLDALASVSGAGLSGVPDLSGRDWALVGEQHLAAYEGALRAVRA